MITMFEKGGPVMYPLLLCSLVALTFIIERTIFWVRQGRGRNDDVVNRILEFAEKSCYDKVHELSQGATDFIARMLYCGILHREFSFKDALVMSAETEAGEQADLARELGKYASKKKDPSRAG